MEDLSSVGSEKDHCSFFPEYWYRWTWKGFKRIHIGDCCKIHDEDCSTRKFLKCLWDKRVAGTFLIALGGASGCWYKYTNKMKERL